MFVNRLAVLSVTAKKRPVQSLNLTDPMYFFKFLCLFAACVMLMN